jgi:cholesterol oxidase
MAMLAGMGGVRSIVSSQVGVHIEALASTRVKSLLYVPEMLGAVGVRSMTMRTDARDGWVDKLYNSALALHPAIEAEERCDNPVCRRITFLFAPLFEHEQLNDATHEAMHEMFGVCSMENLQHLSAMARAGHLVDADGADVYLPRPERLALPITYIHGAENQTWLPRATERTVEWLSASNGAQLYRRHVIPLYGHIDCIFGKDAARDVYPLILQHLEETAHPNT